MNEDFFLSDKGPQYVLATLEPIDQRFPPLEDALLLRDLLINCNLNAIEGGFLLLQSKSHEKPRLTLLREGTVGPGHPIDLSPYGDANIWLEVDVEPAAIGRLRQLLYQLPTMHLRVWCTAPAKSPQEFCAPAPMMAAGFLASPLLTNDEELLAVYEGKPVLRPTAYSVELGSSAFLWKSEIRFRIYKIENSFAGRASSTSGKTTAVP
jgi:hypothetical protein